MVSFFVFIRYNCFKVLVIKVKDKIAKFVNVMKRDGFFKTIKKTLTYVMGNYVNKINIIKRVKFIINKDKISNEIDDILNLDYDRILVWRGSFGWNVPLYQRPQQIANYLINKRCLILYEVTRMTDKVDFIIKMSNANSDSVNEMYKVMDTLPNNIHLVQKSYNLSLF